MIIAYIPMGKGAVIKSFAVNASDVEMWRESDPATRKSKTLKSRMTWFMVPGTENPND